MSTSSAALHQIRELRCDFLLNQAAWGLPVHQVEGKRKTGSRSQRRTGEGICLVCYHAAIAGSPTYFHSNSSVAPLY